VAEQITTAEALGALPVGSVVLDRDGWPLWRKPYEGWCAANGTRNIEWPEAERDGAPFIVLYRPDAESAAPVADDEREALGRVIFLDRYPGSEGAWDSANDAERALWYGRADVILAAGYHRTPASAATVEAAADVLRENAGRGTWLERAQALADAGMLAGVVTEHTSDGHHTFAELYDYRMLYNAHAARGWLSVGIPVVKSRRHSDGEACFGGGWFIVTATLPTGQVSNHYRDEFWDLFDVPEADLPPEWDGHTPQDAADRLRAVLVAPREGGSTSRTISRAMFDLALSDYRQAWHAADAAGREGERSREGLLAALTLVGVEVSERG